MRMDEAAERLAGLRDERIPALPAMLGPEAAAMLSVAVAARGGALRKARPAHASWYPGRSLAVTYQADVSYHGAKPVQELLVARAGRDLPEGPMVLGQGDLRVAVWRADDDPALPGLATVMDSGRCRDLADSLDAPPGRIRPRLRAYRPERRAVVELSAQSFRLFAKVVPPARVAALQALHATMAGHLPVPASHGWSAGAGLVLLEPLPGTTLRTALANKRATLPAAGELAALLDRMPALPESTRATSPLRTAAGHTDLLRLLVPEMAPDLDALVASFEDIDDESAPLVPVHGDFHEAQLTVQRGRVSGLLDIDTAAMGHRIDDWATLIGHLATLGEAGSKAFRQRVRAHARGVLAVAERETDGAALRQRVAAVIVGLATGPFRAQTSDWPAATRSRIELAKQWLESAERIARDERPLMAVSGASHRAVRT